MLMPSNLVAISKMLCVANSAISEDQENSICNRFLNLSNKDFCTELLVLIVILLFP